MRPTIDDHLARARGRFTRVTATEAARAQAGGAWIVDTRAGEDRSRDGGIPGALHYPLAVVEWRLDPVAPLADPRIDFADTIILVCREGYSSSLAAERLIDLGFAGATDLIDGFVGWLAADLPVER